MRERTEINGTNKTKTTLLIMAAGIGSRFGGGIKQLEQFGNCVEAICEKKDVVMIKQLNYEKIAGMAL